MNSELKDVIAAVANCATIIAIVVGGIWTYLLFVRQRLGLPRLNTVITPHAVRIDQGWLLHVRVDLKNTGSVVLPVRYAELRMLQVVPLPKDIATKITNGFDPVDSGETGILWPMLAHREWNWERSAFEIEPGESDSVASDFFVPEDVSVLELYFYLANERKRQKGIGWTTTILQELKRKEVNYMTERTGYQTIEKQQLPQENQTPLQQRQQKQQTPQQQQQPTQPKQQQVPPLVTKR